ncbi:MAG: UvrD-helicase domain-containing protein [Cyanobacteria bacterium]|nr:UvrD-helicase domain-containing protein [Cyanobacteriota bacterium]
MMSTTSMSGLLDKLNPSQQNAVSHPNGPLLILAGAGSGKTRVLTHKIAYKLENGASPDSILAVTFTNKAAKEMRVRIETLVNQSLSGGYNSNFWIGTFHGICGRILRREIQYYQTPAGRQWDPRFVIYDETQSIAAMKQVVKEQNLDEKLYNPKSIRYMISGFKNQLIDAYQYASSAKDYRAEKLAVLFDAYEALLSRNNALDFDDLLMVTVKLFQNNPDRLDRYHQQFQHFLVDEFQDTNDAQYELVRLLVEGCKKEDRSPALHKMLWANRSLTVVGDADQSIYSWRGANFRILMNFQSDFPDAQVIKLLENYRSTSNILSIANAIIENNEDRLPKELISIRGKGEAVSCFEAKDDREEAFYLIDRLLQITQSGQFKPGDCCFLYRTNQQSRAIEDVLISKGLPYTVIGGLKFYERREIKDVLSYLTVIFNDQDGYSVKRVLNVPKRGIGKATLERLEAAASQRGITLYQQLREVESVDGVTPKAVKAIAGFIKIVEALKAAAETATVEEMIVLILETTGYYDELKEEDPTDSEGRIGNVEEFVTVARQFLIETPGGGLAEFLTQMALLSDIDSAEPAENKFVLMTLHAAKGLEFPVVAIGGMEEGLLPHFRSLNDKDGMEEERRLMYVGVTRAMDRLFLSYARRRMIMGEFKYTTPSRFLKEIPAQFLSGSYTLDQESRLDVDSLRRPAVGGGGGRPQPKSSSSSYQGEGYTSTPYHEDSLSRFAPRKTTGIPPKSANTSSTAGSGYGGASPVAFTGPVFAVGQQVSHPKFGVGVVEQVIGSGDKAIYNIQFESISGKKLLDPKFAKLEGV